MTYKTHLVWSNVADGEWHAGGLEGSYSIVRTANGKYSLRTRRGDDPSRRIGTFETLHAAQQRAQHSADAYGVEVAQ
ncbi:MAG TPA: hypothetical protein PL193_07795 [Xanthobacteraceae bacterium]|nr:hypothetical protein [Xanthobacteraceae bacterium]